MARGDTARSLMEIDFLHIYVVHEIARAGSIARAARSLGLSQPATSDLLARLEHYLRQPIFTRSRSGVQPTAFGHDFLAGSDHFLPIFSDLLADLASRKTVSDSDVRDQRLRFGGVPSAATTAVMATLLKHQRLAGARMRQDLDSAELLTRLRKGRLEMAVVIDHTVPDRLGDPPGVSSRPLGTGVWTVSVGPGHRLHETARASLADLKDEHWVLTTHLRGTAKTALLRACSAAGFLPRIIAEIEPSALAPLVLGGHGVGLDIAAAPRATASSGIQLMDGPAPVRYLLVWRTHAVTRREVDLAVRAGTLALDNDVDELRGPRDGLGTSSTVGLDAGSGTVVSSPAVA